MGQNVQLPPNTTAINAQLGLQVIRLDLCCLELGKPPNNTSESTAASDASGNFQHHLATSVARLHLFVGLSNLIQGEHLQA